MKNLRWCLVVVLILIGCSHNPYNPPPLTCQYSIVTSDSSKVTITYQDNVVGGLISFESNTPWKSNVFGVDDRLPYYISVKRIRICGETVTLSLYINRGNYQKTRISDCFVEFSGEFQD